MQLSRTLAKTVPMSAPRRTLTNAEMQAEWQEVQAAQQDPAHFRPLYERYFDKIFLFIFRRTNDEGLAGDICSQVFLKAMERLYSYEYKGVPFSAWLYRIASNEVAQHYRKASKNRVVSINEAQLGDMAEDMDEPSHLPDPQALVPVLDTLKEEELQLIELRYFEGLPYREIAEIMDITENNAKVKAFRILNRLKKRMA